MDRRTEYELFLRNFHALHGFLPPPSYEEWVYNFNPVGFPNNSNPRRNVQTNLPANMSANAYALNQSTVHVPVTATASNVCGARTSVYKNVASNETRANWSLAEEDILVIAWKENVLHLETTDKNLAWTKIASSVCSVGNKTLKQCKDKIRNLKDLYKAAKDKNKRTGESLNTSPFYATFDEVLGCKHNITMPHVTEVGVKTNLASIEKQPTRMEVETFLKTGKKRKQSSTNVTEMKKMVAESETRREKFLSNLLAEQMEAEKAEREKDRDLLRELFKKDN